MRVSRRETKLSYFPFHTYSVYAYKSYSLLVVIVQIRAIIGLQRTSSETPVDPKVHYSGILIGLIQWNNMVEECLQGMQVWLQLLNVHQVLTTDMHSYVWLYVRIARRRLSNALEQQLFLLYFAKHMKTEFHKYLYFKLLHLIYAAAYPNELIDQL